MSDPAPPFGMPIRRPRKSPPADPPAAPEPPSNGQFARDAVDPSDEDLKAWQRGVSALTTMPARMRLDLTAGIPELRQAARAEEDAALDRRDRLAWEPEAMLASGIGTRLGARMLAMISTDAPPPLLLGRLDPTGHTVLYGTGGIGKGTLASAWIKALTDAEKRVLIVDYENHPDEWARRFVGLGGTRSDMVLHVAPLTAAWGGTRGPLWKTQDDLHDLAQQFEADYMVIDSIVPACAGSDPLKPESVSLYTGALEYIGLPALSLGHVTKADDLRYAFGSIFWHNLSRTTWSMARDGDATVLTHRKHNNYEHVPPQRIDVAFDAEGLPVEVWERLYAEDMTRRISSVLIGGAKSASDIADELNDLSDDESSPISSGTIRKILSRGARANPPKFVKAGRVWTNA